MSRVNSINRSELDKLKNDICTLMKSGEIGTVQYFCDKTGHDDDRDVAACIGILENEGKAELLQVEEAHQSCGSPIYMGVYGKPT
jgi:hypothetical protein